MSTRQSCPNASELSDLVDGNLIDPELSDFASHLEQCTACQQTVRSLSSQGTLAESLRGEITLVETITRQTPQVMVERLKLIPSLDIGDSALSNRGEANIGHATQHHFFKDPTAECLGTLGRYRVLKLLGSGGMGSVFLAEDSKLNRHVALKVMLPKIAAEPTSKERFLREARAAASLKSDHIVTVYHVDEEDDVPYLAMELLEGQSLDSVVCSSGILPIHDVIHIVSSVAKGLADAHEKGLVHRDIKPGNIWIGHSEEGPARVKILDFGLARLEMDETHLTHAHAIVGTPAFMAPEQASGEKVVDARSDLFSLGCVLYFLCTGDVPFKAPSTLATLMALAVNTPIAPADRNALVPLKLSKLAMRLLEKEPENRPAMARDVIASLKEIKQELENGTAEFASSSLISSVACQHVMQQRRGVLLRRGALACALLAMICVGIWLSGVFPTAMIRNSTIYEPKSGASSIPLVDRANEKFGKLFDAFSETNPKFDGVLKPGFADGEITELTISGIHVVELDALRELKHLQKLTLEGDDGRAGALIDLTPVHELSLRELTLRRNYVVTDLNALRGMPLKVLIADYSPISDLSPLEGMPLDVLQIWNWNGSDLSPVREAPLTWVNIGGNGQAMDLWPLSGAPLVFLCINSSKVSDISPLRGAPLRQFFCNNTDVSDLSPIKDAPIEEIMLRGTPVKDISLVKNWPLKWIEWEIGFTEGIDILKRIPTLQRINDRSAEEYFREIESKASASAHD